MNAKVLVPVLVAGAFFSTVCTAAALVTGMDTVFWVAGILAALCLVSCIGILDHEAHKAMRAYRRQVWERRDAEARATK